jgi:hypothetical protein
MKRQISSARAVVKENLELKLIQTQITQKPMLRAEVYARALRASKNVNRAEEWVGARCEGSSIIFLPGHHWRPITAVARGLSPPQ